MLPSGERLRANALFKQVFQAGRGYADPLLVLHVQRLPDAQQARAFGFSVSKKVGNAVARNRVRRRLRAIVRGLSPELGRGYRAVLVARAPAAQAEFGALTTAVRRLCARAGLVAEAAADADGV